MAKAPQLAAVIVALVLVLSAGGYGIARGLTAKDYSAYNACVRDYERQTAGRHCDFSPGGVCHRYLPD